ncbi:MAG: hypothetical protein SRB2_00091 [Desulfobacteraceae bacterium Eth-SRB2]|nr:MAG: hypothetical protein SRB2_00091 [Desulfobacteraceae bacterium Eth-SRB2]
MQKNLRKYFWDGSENISEEYKLKRILEYASFPDLIKYPFPRLKENISKINIHNLRTSEKRIKFILLMRPLILSSESWDEAMGKLMSNIDRNLLFRG